ncbi:MAG: zinc ribbon domain-containing protein [Verrucomicrobiota bacterium]|jgi:putative FmdB family regulatory protein|nr:zinc ribbon domain-containing protein [Verrucomicrobiota bacterium]
MPTYLYQATAPDTGCPRCAAGFETVQSVSDPRLAACPSCGAPVRRVITAPAIGRSKSKLDDRAKASGFTKLKRIGKGEYEKMY